MCVYTYYYHYYYYYYYLLGPIYTLLGPIYTPIGPPAAAQQQQPWPNAQFYYVFIWFLLYFRFFIGFL